MLTVLIYVFFKLIIKYNGFQKYMYDIVEQKQNSNGVTPMNAIIIIDWINYDEIKKTYTKIIKLLVNDFEDRDKYGWCKF